MKPIFLHIVLCAAMILCIGNVALGQDGPATITKTIDSLKIISAELGDKLYVKLEVNNPYSNPVLVDDNLGSALKYIAGTCMLDGTSLTPTFNDNMISFLVEMGNHVITYEFQVVQVEASNTYINNLAHVYSPDFAVEDEDAVQITLSPYNGFFKWLSSNDYNIEEPLPLEEDLKFTMEVNVRNYFNFTMEDLEVSDDLPAEFEIDECLSLDMGDIVLRTMKGKAKKVRWVWTIGDLDPPDATDDGVSLKLIVSTALNPSGKQHFISPGWYDIAKEVVIKCKDPLTGNQLRANTGSLSVYAGPTP
jgi:hypothetical protein